MPIFISHSEKDKSTYSQLCTALKAEGLDYWDPKIMRAGVSLKDQLREAITECDICIFIATKNSIKSDWCLVETGAFWGANKRIIAFKAGSEIEESKLPPPLQGDLWTDDMEEVVHQAKQESNQFAILEDIDSIPLPSALSLSAFAYTKPDWLSNEAAQTIRDLAKGALLLLAFDRTDSGCWGKTYLYRRKATGNDLPHARGSLTGTPLALISMFSLAGQNENIVLDWTSPLISETLATTITPEGRYLRGLEFAQMGQARTFEPLRHVAGGCLATLFLGTLGQSDLAAINLLCAAPPEPIAYDKAIISRTLLQASFTKALPHELRLAAIRKENELLEMLVESANRSSNAVHTWADQYEYGVDTNNQWGVIAWILPRVILSVKNTQNLNQDLEDILRKFLLAKAAKDRSRNDLQQGIINKGGNAKEREVFGTTTSLIAWRTLELYSWSASCRRQASIQAQKAVSRLSHSSPDILELPSTYPEKKPEALEGYLGWTGLCLAAASLGIRISVEEYKKELDLTEKLNSAIDLRLSRKQQQSRFSKLVHQVDDFSPEIAAAIIRSATKVAELYKTII